MTDKQYLTIFVENNAGVLARVSLLFCKRGFNIDSLTVSATDDPKLSRITVVTHGDQNTFNQIIKQTQKLVETKLIFPIEPQMSVIRELLMVKLAVDDDGHLEEIKHLSSQNGARIVDTSYGCAVIEMTGEPAEIDRLLELIKPYNMLEMSRTGATALEKGKKSYINK